MLEPDTRCTGYQSDFLGPDFVMPLPAFSPALARDVLRKQTLKDACLISLVMSRTKKQAIFSAANADFSQKGLFGAKDGNSGWIRPSANQNS